MIRFKRLTSILLDAWLVNQAIPSAYPPYRLRVWRENRAGLDAIQAELIAYIDEALDDARKRLRCGFEDDLSPFNNDPATDPAANYPALLNRITLQGYWGEILACLAVEHWGAHGNSDWQVPAFLFRFHNQEFQHLEMINERILNGENYNYDEADKISQRRPGRTGDDGLAFRINQEGSITDVLTLEAKCLSSHNTSTLEDAHKKLVVGTNTPPGIKELISLFSDYNTSEANIWQQALLKLWKERCRNVIRHDGVGYACGQPPKRTASWMSTDNPHSAYTASRNLEGMEFQFEDMNTIIDILFRGDGNGE